MQRLKQIIETVLIVIGVILLVGVFALLIYGYTQDPCSADPFGFIDPTYVRGVLCD